jgi:hypothetical protein
MNNYIININVAQLELIMKALDFYSRIQMGQLSELANPYIIQLPESDYAEIDKQLLKLKKIMFPELDDKTFYSIKTKKIPDTIRQTVDILDVIRYRLAWDTNTEETPTGMKYNKPIHWSNEHELITIKKVDDATT